MTNRPKNRWSCGSTGEACRFRRRHATPPERRRQGRHPEALAVAPGESAEAAGRTARGPGAPLKVITRGGLPVR
ncbi:MULTISPECIES: hypothetical protein [unclassified Streptomyces]|uniref:hypothetical protein n=1 Tax=unclassified Streptomyces TaxID=2593676 RepID=UPI0035D94BCF